MRHKIAFITTEYVKPHLERVLPQLGMDAAFSIYAYHPFEEIDGFFRQIPREVDGVITSGNRFGSAFRHMFPRDRRVVVPMGINDAEVHRLFWRLKQEQPDLDFQRIYADFLDELHLSIPSFLTEDHGIPLSVSMDAGREQTPEEFLRGEYRQFQKLLEVWETGQFERIITRYSGLLPMLRQRGVQIFYPFPSIDSIRSACAQAQREIEMRQLQDYQAAEIHVNLWMPNPAYTVESLYEQRLLQLQQSLMDYFGSKAEDMLFRRSHFGVDILTDRKTVAQCTREYTVCELSAFLNARLDFWIFVGYGIGQGIYQARLNAITATRESEVSGGSYLVNEQDVLIGPLGGGEAAPPSPSVFSYMSSHAGISQATINRVLEVLGAMPNGRLTSQELAERLEITRRSANYFLKAMTQTGILQVVDMHRAAGRGRPEQVYGRAAAENTDRIH